MNIYKNVLFFVISLLVTSIVFEISSYILYKKYNIFYQTPDNSEENLILYSTLDPWLGYTFNPFLPNESKFPFANVGEKLHSGFIKFQHLSEKKPIKIAIMGGSATDSNLFDGNWPYSLHKLLINKNISHIIYNGAVSGYSTNQELIKTIRDVFDLDQIDIVISYSGFNDSIDGGDITENFPSVHPYQKYLFDELAGNQTFFKDSTFFPNTTYVVKKIISRYFQKDVFIQTGVGTKFYSHHFIKNLDYMNQISLLNSAKFFHFLQPLIKSTSQVNYQRSLNSKVENEKILKFHKFFAEIETDLKKRPYSTSLVDVFDETQAVFFDYSHLSQEGNNKVSEVIFNFIKESLK